MQHDRIEMRLRSVTMYKKLIKRRMSAKAGKWFCMFILGGFTKMMKKRLQTENSLFTGRRLDERPEWHGLCGWRVPLLFIRSTCMIPAGE